MNSIPDHTDDQTHFKKMHDFSTYEQLRAQVELEAKRLRGLATEMCQSSAMTVQTKRKRRVAVVLRGRRFQSLITPDQQMMKLKKKKACRIKKSKKVDKSKAKCHNYRKHGHFTRECTKQKRYTNVA